MPWALKTCFFLLPARQRGNVAKTAIQIRQVQHTVRSAPVCPAFLASSAVAAHLESMEVNFGILSEFLLLVSDDGP